MARLTPVFVATTLAAGIVAGIFWQQLHAERARTAQLQERVNQLELEQAAAPVVPQIAAGSAAAAPEPLPVVAAAPTPAQPPPPAADAASSTAFIQNLTRDPEFCNAQKAQMRAALPQTYPDAAKALGLSKTESTALFDLLTRQQEGVVDMACGPQNDTRQARLSGEALMQAQQAELKTLLGPAKYAEWEEYLPSREGRVRVNQLRTALAMGDAPLTDEQAEPLLATVLAEGKRRRAENSSRVAPADPRARLDFEEETIKLLEESHARMISSTQAYLSPQQVAVMRNSMSNQVSMQKAMLRARRAQMDAGGNTQDTANLVVAPF